MTANPTPLSKPYSDKDESWFIPPVIVPLIIVLAIAARALFLAT